MSELGILDKAFQSIMQRMVQTGHEPFYMELADDLDVSPEEGRKVLHQLFSTGVRMFHARSFTIFCFSS